jgi:hypothetical protein
MVLPATYGWLLPLLEAVSYKPSLLMFDVPVAFDIALRGDQKSRGCLHTTTLLGAKDMWVHVIAFPQPLLTDDVSVLLLAAEQMERG